MGKGEIIEIPIGEIIANPHQPRQVFDEVSLLELAESISHHGLLQPIVVRLNDDNQYELIAGERRLRATELNGNMMINAIVKDMSTKDSAYMAMIENIQRDDLHFVEVAKGYKRLMNDFDLTQSDLMAIVGKSQSAIANKIRILNLSDEILNLLIEHDLTERHGRALLKLKENKLQLKAVKNIAKKELNVKESEKYIERLLKPNIQEQHKPEIIRFIKDIRLFTNTIKQAVDAINSAGMEASYTVREEDEKYTITIDIPIER